ncbi:hypothetical protein IW139_002069 [Coemansia sp. RSA 353]|nr:hypothetical protein IW144_003871 [Coemansia sp. RSA 522]KAJ2204047.1 hypothetical protein IW145_003687 [Coemansia sp. RSA 521]KAJ2230567.1 hypothetical protein EV180_000895 [Coemansia sp. RSA 518]KAJ2271190.1 hypothetical protein J3F81_003571 [Coemansia sp. RSA 371]KAJ2298829.1 hypothetical protein IW139_002069 [Coemansia sp. RSA 353]
MTRAIPRPAGRTSVAPSSDQGCGFGGAMGVGPADMITRKRSLDNVENIPPFGLDGVGKSAVSLLDLAAAQHSQSQRKQRRTVITASSPGGHQRMASNPRRVGTEALRTLSQPQNNEAAQPHTHPRMQMPPLLQLPPLLPQGRASTRPTPASGSRLRRLPKRNLKPLDFSGLHRAGRQNVLTSGATSSDTAGATAANKAGSHSSGLGGAEILSLPVSPVQSSPVSVASSSAESLDALDVTYNSVGAAQPTPPGSGQRQPTAFSGLLASAYRRASAKRWSKRALSFGGSDDTALMQSDPVLGPRCPVIGGAYGMFGSDVTQGGSGEVQGRSGDVQDLETRQAQAAFEAAVAAQTQNGRGRRGKARVERPVSQCKYCGKQYKYHSKLASHEQHCSSRLEALLYSADEAEQHTIHCVCGPRHERPAGSRDTQPMVQCDNCLKWLHIECVRVDEQNLPEEYYCPRCAASSGNVAATPSTPRRGRGWAVNIMSPESHRLATLLADVPDNDGSETEEEPMSLRVRGRPAPVPSSDDTMSISDVAEVTRFHRQGSNVTCRSPVLPRMAQSEADVSLEPTPSQRRRRRARAQATVHTDAPSSDFLGLPFPESIFSAKPSFVGGLSASDDLLSIAPALCTQQGSMDDLSQWSLAQLSTMLGGAGEPAGGDGLADGSSFLLGHSLADLGLGLDAGAAQAPFGADAGGLGLPVDNDFSALLESITGGGDAYTSLTGNSHVMGVNHMSDFGVDVGHGSSSTITIMHDDGSQDHVVGSRAPAVRPPPGPAGMARTRSFGGTKRGSLVSTSHGLGAESSRAVALSLPSNPPSTTGLSDLDVGQLLSWQPDGDVLEREMEGLINFDG